MLGCTLQVKQQLEGVAEHAVWSQAAPTNEFNLPSFSVSPSSNITAVGEYLMMLPTLLETLLTDGDEATEDESHVDGEWLDKVHRICVSLPPLRKHVE